MTSQKTVCVGGFGQRGGLSFFFVKLYILLSLSLAVIREMSNSLNLFIRNMRRRDLANVLEDNCENCHLCSFWSLILLEIGFYTHSQAIKVNV